MATRLSPLALKSVGLFPNIWLSLFCLLPIIVLIVLSLSYPVMQAPPFRLTPEGTEAALLGWVPHWGNFANLLQEETFVECFWYSLKLSLCATSLTLVIGFMVAFAIYQSDARYHLPLLVFFILPFFTSVLIRIYAWMPFLSSTGFINQLLSFLMPTWKASALYGNDWVVILAIVSCYLPFSIFPIYASLLKIDVSLYEAAITLGANRWRICYRITLPLIASGLRMSATIIFLPTLGEFLIPEILGSSESMTMGKLLWSQFFHQLNWPEAAAVGLTIVTFFLLMPRIIEACIKQIFQTYLRVRRCYE